MKLEKTASSLKRKAGSSAVNVSGAKSANSAPAGENAERPGGRPAKLSPGERKFAIESAEKYGAERSVFADGVPERDWLEAEIEVELDRLRNRDSQLYD